MESTLFFLQSLSSSVLRIQMNMQMSDWEQVNNPMITNERLQAKWINDPWREW